MDVYKVEKHIKRCLLVKPYFASVLVIAAIGIVSVENGASGAGNATEKRSAANADALAHVKGGDAPGHGSVKGRWEEEEEEGEVEVEEDHQRRAAADAGTEKGRGEKRRSSHEKEAESVTAKEIAKGEAGAGRGEETGIGEKAQREVKRAQAG